MENMSFPARSQRAGKLLCVVACAIALVSSLMMFATGQPLARAEAVCSGGIGLTLRGKTSIQTLA